MRTGRLALALGLAAFGCAPAQRGRLPDPMRAPHARGTVPAPAPDGEARGPAAATPPPITCEQHPRIDAWEDKLRTSHAHRVTTDASLERAEPLLPELRRVFEDGGLPSSLALVPVVESSFKTSARERARPGGAVGLWQLRGPTARRFGLVVNRKRDDRLHAKRSTEAAARYFAYLHRRYGDWPLTLAAYNAGEGRVDRARARQPGASFWELADRGALPRISVDFVPRVLAVIRLVDEDRACGPSSVASAGDTFARD
jgi:hypothetical protein